MARSGVLPLVLALVFLAAWSGSVMAASDDRAGSISASGHSLNSINPAVAAHQQTIPLESCEVTLAEVGLHAITYAGQCLGLDIVSYHGAEEVSFTSNSDTKVFFADPDTGAELASFNLHPANTGVFGNHEWNGMFFNDWSLWDRYFTDTDGVGWSTYDDPAQNAGRGMDFDPANQLVWETYSSTGLYAFGPTNSSGTYFDISAWIPGQMSGLAVYPYGAGTGIAVAVYLSTQVHFFEFTGSTVNFVGCANLPQSNPVDESLGLTYSETRGTFFWSYLSDSGDRWLSELYPSGLGFTVIFGDDFESGDTGAWSSSLP